MTTIKQPELVKFKGEGAGPHLVVSGAIHGNEKCGPAAIQRVLQCIDDGRITIKAGHVTFIPVANPLAYQLDKRFVDRNLNRNLYPKDEPAAYEDHLDNTLCAAFREADVLLDLHSFTAPGEAFVLLGPPRKAEADYARALGVRNFVHGWADVYKKNAEVKDPRTSQGTTEYARLTGALAVTLEGGQHKDPESIEVAFQGILNALEYLGIADIDPDLFEARPVSRGPARCVRLTEVFYKTEEGSFPKPWQNMSPVKKGELLATFNSGKTISAPEDGFVIMPFEKEKIGAEWFYFAVKSDYFEKLDIQ